MKFSLAKELSLVFLERKEPHPISVVHKVAENVGLALAPISIDHIHRWSHPRRIRAHFDPRENVKTGVGAARPFPADARPPATLAFLWNPILSRILARRELERVASSNRLCTGGDPGGKDGKNRRRTGGRGRQVRSLEVTKVTSTRVHPLSYAPLTLVFTSGRKMDRERFTCASKKICRILL